MPRLDPVPASVLDSTLDSTTRPTEDRRHVQRPYPSRRSGNIRSAEAERRGGGTGPGRDRRLADADPGHPDRSRAAEAPERPGVRHRLGGHRHPARGLRRHTGGGQARRHVRQAPDAAGQHRAAGVRFGGLRARRLPHPDDHRARPAGPRGSGRPARHQHHARRHARRPAGRIHRADERLTRRRRRPGPAQRRVHRRQLGLAHPLLGLRGPGRRRPRPGHADRAGVEGARPAAGSTWSARSASRPV